jgi:hypothetical protein
MHDDPQRLRAAAVRLFAMAIDARELHPGYADKLVAEAMALQDQATAIEEAANMRPPSEAPQAIQMQQQVQPKKDDE